MIERSSMFTRAQCLQAERASDIDIILVLTMITCFKH